MSTARLDQLKDIETKVQSKWNADKVYESTAPEVASGTVIPPKFFVTFPYPYMNGKLHLGHAFSLSKAEFAVRFQRMQGRRVMWPFGLHVTGTPIAACAKKLANEIEKYGNPPEFPESVLDGTSQEKKENTLAPGQYKSKRGKTGPAKPQWVIMQSLGIPDEEIHRFSDANYWLQYFPSLAVEDLKRLGVHVDWRRSFITTEVNKFYDSFIKWQFDKLREGGYLGFGKRYSVYSPIDGQPCADHDRASGEGVGPQEYCVVKQIVKNPLQHECFAAFKDIIGDKDVILPCATLRSETIVGQTNCWVSSEFSYKAYEVTNKTGKSEIFIMTARAARNMCFQDIIINGVSNGEVEHLFEIPGPSMIGLPLKAPYCPYDTIYTLPMGAISENKGTGIVMSVPSDSCDDYVNFMQLVKKPDYRAKLGIKDEWVVPFEIVPIINIPGELGTESAAETVKKLSINGPKETVKLEEAKKIVYQAAFYTGEMIAGPFKGCKVAEAKVKMMHLLIEKEEGMRYFEPTKEVISRSGDECVVALCDQWFIEYGREDWKKSVIEHVEGMEMYFPSIRNGFDETLNWLSDWPCSRTFGLGTKMPCDASNTMIIDSLSDSTIYMAYYTIAHFFHCAADGSISLDATKPNKYGITSEMMTTDVWNYILKGTGTAEEVSKSSGLSTGTLTSMRNEFSFWYPVDLRVSAKDLIQNHLTMFLYNHAAIWPEDKSMWPRSIYCNGHIMVDNEKMSKSQGNFIMLNEAIGHFGADCTRLACADAGDSMDDANFVRETANGFILKLTALIDQCKELVAKADSYRTGEMNIFDMIFSNRIASCIINTKNHYSNMCFRMALNSAYYDLIGDFNQYRLACDENPIHKDLVLEYMETIVLLMQPLAPHISEYIWLWVLNKPTTIIDGPFPVAKPINYSMNVASRIINDLTKDIRTLVQKSAKKRNVDEVFIYVATSFLPWQTEALKTLHTIYKDNNNSFPDDTAKQVASKKEPWLTDDIKGSAMAFMAFVRANVDKYGVDALGQTPSINDQELLNKIEAYIAKTSNVKKINIRNCEDESIPEHKAARLKCRPGEPSIVFPPVSK
eukprot:Tbor_TRINITY_DN1878_c0_g1::TRINITY_DN1878_c0_g1_i1::g.23030::m.23030/K01869/LARS, leuS; leucyl-tRNA synthetase